MNRAERPVEFSNNLLEIFKEVKRAEEKHPAWPNEDVFFALSIISEELGEAHQAAIDYKVGGQTLKQAEHVREEVIQVAATCMRFLLNF